MDKEAIGPEKIRIRLLERSLEELENAVAGRPDIRGLSESACFSPYYYQRLFRRYVGDSVMEYVKKRRLTQAGRELCESGRTVLEIALDWGYDSYEGFARAFKAYHGIPPSDCRRYGLYASFEGIHALREGIIMPATKAALSKRVATLQNRLNILAAAVFRTGELSAGAGKALSAFAVVGEELPLLAGRVKECASRLAGLERRLREEADPPVRECAAMLDTLDLLAFQTHILSLNIGIQSARTPPEYRDLAKPVEEAGGKLGELIRQVSPDAAGMMAELSGLVFEDLRAERQRLAASLSARLCQAAEEMERVGRGAERRGGGFLLLGGKTREAAARLGALSEQGAHEEGALQALPSVVLQIGFQMNVLAFHGKLEGARRGGISLAEPMVELAGRLHSLAAEAEAAVGRLCELSRLLGNQPVHPPSPARRLEQAISEGLLLSFHAELEAAGLHPAAAGRVKQALRSFSGVVSSLRENQAEPEQALASYREAITGLQRLLRELGEESGERGRVWSFFARELAKQAETLGE